MSAITTIFGVVFRLALLVVWAAWGYLACNWGLDVFGTLEPQVATITTIASMVTVFCATINDTRIRGNFDQRVVSPRRGILFGAASSA